MLIAHNEYSRNLQGGRDTRLSTALSDCSDLPVLAPLLSVMQGNVQPEVVVHTSPQAFYNEYFIGRYTDSRVVLYTVSAVGIISIMRPYNSFMLNCGLGELVFTNNSGFENWLYSPSSERREQFRRMVAEMRTDITSLATIGNIFSTLNRVLQNPKRDKSTVKKYMERSSILASDFPLHFKHAVLEEINA